MSRRAPVWLGVQSRFAGMRKKHAWAALALLVLLLALCMTALTVADPSESATAMTSQSDQTDLMLYEKIVAGVRGGGDYYTVASDAMRAGRYPLHPFLTMRMPGLATLQGALPEWGPVVMLFLLAGAVGVAWGARLGDALPRTLPRIVAAILLIGSMLAFLQPGLVAFHEIWAGLLVALSLGVRRPGRWIEAVAFALAAMLIRETAALYALLMLVIAWLEGERREVIGWSVALALFAAALGAHAYAVSGVTGPLDPVSPGWSGLLGFGFFVKSLTLATALQLFPLWAGAPLVGLALFGWASWEDPLALRMLVILAGYAVVIGIFARLDTFYWALIVAPTFLVGLAFVPDGLRDLIRQSLDKRRITVTRVAR